MTSEHYAIANIADMMALSDEQKEHVCGIIVECMDTVRRSLDGTKVVVKWNGDINPLEDVGVPHDIYTYGEILEIVHGTGWHAPR